MNPPCRAGIRPLLLMLVAAIFLAARWAEGGPPNVLLILTDDQGYGDFSFTGNPQLQTPRLDALAKEGVRFSNFYVSSLCSPTRASLLTGRYSQRTGVWGVTGNKETMRAEEVTMAEALRGAGYRTALFGKWHNGEHYPHDPRGQGFDQFFGFRGGHWNNYHDSTLERDDKPAATKGYIADVLTDAAIEFMSQERREPFFCYVAFNTPHAPFQVGDAEFERFKKAGLPDELACIYGMCANIDANVGRMLDALERTRLADNTLVLFLTDNGPNGDRYNAGLRGRKGNIHEGGCKTPLLVRWPGKIKGGQVIDRIAAHIDIMPTVLDLCGAAAPPGVKLDGVSLRPLLEGREGGWAERRLYRHNFRGNRVETFPGAVRTQRWLAVNEGRGWELYDLEKDPGQKTNVGRENAEVLRELSRDYERWYADVSKAGFVKLPIPVGHPESPVVNLRAPQAELSGGTRFFGGQGWANDWAVGFGDRKAIAEWDLDVLASGDYEVSLEYLNSTPVQKVAVLVEAGGGSCTAELAGGPRNEVALRDRVIRKEAPEMEWRSQAVDRLRLEKGRVKLRVSGAEALELKTVRLRRVD